MSRLERASVKEFIKDAGSRRDWLRVAFTGFGSAILVALLLAEMDPFFRSWHLPVLMICLIIVDGALAWWVLGFKSVQEWLRKELR